MTRRLIRLEGISKLAHAHFARSGKQSLVAEPPLSIMRPTVARICSLFIH
jgi:hypothetical protein